MTILAAYAPTDLGERVLQAALEEAARRGTDLIVVNSATGAAYADKGLATPEQLEAVTKAAEGRGVTLHVRRVPDAQTAADAILEEASHAGVDLLVIGLRNRTRSGKFLLGSTSQTVLLRATCNVLAVKDPTTA